ncbi:MAG: NUDIX hydrolase [Trueperaceae bacterium]|nr:NUDIX hydrolase [Trueperaceae bacterium]
MTERRIFQGRILDLVVLDDRWEVVRHADAVAVLARDATGRVLGVVQRRPAVAADTWELPAGLIDAGEGPVAAAARELAEEANLAGDLTLIAQAFVSPGFTDERVHLFEARALRPAAGALDDGEELTVAWRDPGEAWAAALRGELTTSMVTLLGLRHALAADAAGADAAGAAAGGPGQGGP